MNKNSISLEPSQKKAALTAGIGLLLMTFTAPWVNFSVLGSLVAEGDPFITTRNIMDSVGLFRGAIAGFMVIVILDVLVAWGLYIVFKPMNQGVSLLSAWFRLVYSVLLAVSVFNLVDILELISEYGFLSVFEPAQIHTQVMLKILAFQKGWSLSLGIFGVHLLCLGYLILSWKIFPKFLGLLVALAGLGYLIDSLGSLLFAGYSWEIAMFTFLGEVLLIIWLFIFGLRREKA